MDRPWPNPLSHATAFVLHSDRPVAGRVEVFDVRGRLVKTLLAGASIPIGSTSIGWDGSTDSGQSAAAGIYFIRLRAGNTSIQQRVVRLK